MLILSNAVLGDLDLDDGDAYVTESVALPMPSVRSVTDNRTEADGTWDQTRYVGARAVALAVACFAGGGVSLEARVDALRRYLHPSLRSTLSWTPAGEAEPRQITVRAESHDLVVSDNRWARTTVALVAPEGVVESSTQHALFISPSVGVELGRAYDLTFNRTYPANSTTPGLIATNAGSAPAHWRAALYGPVTNPVLTNGATGESLSFSISVEAGHYIYVDSAAHTALLDNDPDLSVHLSLDLGSRWWHLWPGDNLITYSATTIASGAFCLFAWRDAWL